MSHSLLILAQLGGSGPQSLIFIGILFGIMYLLMIRPQQKQAKELRNLQASLKKGDDVISQAGILGKVFAVADKVVTLEVANGVRIRMLKSSIQGKVSIADEGKSEDKKPDEKKEEK